MRREELPSYSGFYNIPGYEGYAISRNGDVVNVETGRLLKPSKVRPSRHVTNMTGGYHTYSLRHGKALRHRLLALTFIPLPKGHESPKGLVVNHKDGNPENDDIENLEWCTYAENIKHAYDNGLHPNKTIGVLIRNIETGSTERFPSIVKASEYLNIPDAALRSRLRRQPGSAYGKYAAKIDDGSPWPYNYLRQLERIRSLVARNIVSGKLIIADSAVELEDITGVDRGTIVASLARGMTRPYNGFNFKYLDDTSPWPTYTTDQMTVLRTMKSSDKSRYGYKVVDVVDGVDVIIGTIETVADYLGVSVASVAKRTERRQLYDERFLVTRFPLFSTI